jgi:hypothetical protein
MPQQSLARGVFGSNTTLSNATGQATISSSGTALTTSGALTVTGLATADTTFVTSPVAFHAWYVPQPSSTTAGSSIIFTNVVYNYGVGYNSGTGRFTAPYAGMYAFSASINNQTGSGGFSMWLGLNSAGTVFDGNSQTANVIAIANNITSGASAILSAPVHLAANDYVYVGCGAANIGRVTDRFLGTLLYRTS